MYNSDTKKLIEQSNINEDIPIQITIEVTDQPLLILKTRKVPIQFMYLNGSIRKNVFENKTEFKILVKYDDENFQVGSAISEMSNGMLIGLATTKEDRSVQLIWVPIPERLKNKIYRTKIK